MIELESFKNQKDAIVALTNKLKCLIDYRESTKFELAISGGETAKNMFKIWRDEFAKSVPWHCVNFFWVDERIVDLTSEQSNFMWAKKNFFEPLNIPEKNIFNLNPLNKPIIEAERLSNLLRANDSNTPKYFKLDCAILGIGTDGHTASIFPENNEIFNSNRIYKIVQKKGEDFKRLTLTPFALSMIKDIMFLVIGQNKREILHDVLLQSVSSKPKLSAAKILANANLASIFTDMYI